MELRVFASKVGCRSWIGSVQGAVATWSVISMRYFPIIPDFYRSTRSLPLPVLTRSNRGIRPLRQSDLSGLCTKSAVLACEAGASIKPGAQAPGSKHNRFFKPANAGDSPNRDKMILMAANCRPFHGLGIRLILILGLAPQALCSRLLRRLRQHFSAKPVGVLIRRRAIFRVTVLDL